MLLNWDITSFLPFQSYFQLWKSKYKIDTLEVQRQFFSSYSFGLWKVTALWRHFTRCQEIQFFRQFFWSNFQKCKKVHRFWLSPTFWQPPSSHQQLYATWKFRNVISDNCQKASMMWKMAIILPTGQRYAPSTDINDAWYCMVLQGIALYCIVLHGTAWYCMVVHGIALCCIEVHGIAWYCMVLHGIA